MSDKKLHEDDRELKKIMLESLYEREKDAFIPLEEMKQRVLRECIEREVDSKRRRKRIVKRIASIAASVACMCLLGVLLVSVMPTASVSATTWMQQTMYWIGDKLNNTSMRRPRYPSYQLKP